MDKKLGLVGLAGGTVLSALAVVACQHYAPRTEESGQAIPDKVSYNWDVRPILSQNCFRCHGHDPANRKAGLRLDEAATAYGDLPEDHGKHAIVRGKPRSSELFRRITSTDGGYRMPPSETHLRLSKHDIAVLERWIRQGATYQQHWAYIAPKAVKPERTPWDGRAVNEIDRYVYTGLAKAGLAPSAEADRETLINRVALDLTGLPPTLPEVDAFVADRRPDAYERLVDRLLASRAYAERQTNIWMDVARYADSDGYLNDGFGRFQYPYRDWVISAFQRNMPYDRFVTWQLAGDLLPKATREQVLATAFARSGKKSNEGGITDEEYRVEYVNERAELVGKAFLGLTVGCAKCHDHKYDVIAQADYYSLGGFFNSVDERGIASGTGWGPTLAWPTAGQARRLATAHQLVLQKEAAVQAARAAARAQASVAVEARLKAGPAGAPGLIQADLDQAQQAYYPMETVFKAPLEPLLIANNPPRGGGGGRAGPPSGRGGKAGPGGAGLMKVSDRRGSGAPQQRRTPGAKPAPKAALVGEGEGQGARGPRTVQDDLRAATAKAQAEGRFMGGATALPPTQKLLVGLSADKVFWTPNATDPKTPGAINNVHVIDGPPGKGKAILVDDTIAFANRDVGQFERTQPFSLDVWIKLRADKPYPEVNVLYNADRGGAGYQLKLEDNVLMFGLENTAPYNMVEIGMTRPLPKGVWTHVTATYDGSSKAAGAHLYIDGRPVQTEVLQDRLDRSIVPRGGSNTFGSYTGLSFGRQFGLPEFNKGGVDELRVFTRALTPVEAAYLHDHGSLARYAPTVVRSQLIDTAVEQDPQVAAAEAALKSAREAEQAAGSAIPLLNVLGDRMKPRTTYLLDRGNFDQHQKPVPVQALTQVFPWKAAYPRNRLGLTQWLFDPKNPLTARVYVNRLWQGHFGTGIVETVEDFGTQGSNPTNPELLDYLAVEFMRSGWDIKHMQRLIVMSATYRQSSNVSRENLEKDPRNFLLERGPRYRLPAELIRDNALAASGLLVDRPGGDSVFPYQPDSVWDNTGVGTQSYPDETLVPPDEMHRRSLYTFIKRNAQFPSMAVFDLADRNVSTVARKISNTPLQALVLLNDAQYVEAYRKLAERAIRTSARPDDQIVMLFRLATRRRPMASEMSHLRAYRAQQMAHMAGAPDDVDKLLKVGVAPLDPQVSRPELAAATMVAAAIMNSPDAYSLR